ncbi:MAG: hypothetical protein HYX86_01940 [Chloroflexi bacterium]|nr:hypothetical protein [Chloroflexota bacterium]
MNRFLVLLAFSLAALVIGCAPQPPSPGQVEDFDSLAAALEARGATVLFTELEVQQPFFSVSGRLISINGANLQVFEYGDESTARAEAAQISPGGSTVGTTMITWVDTPHFWLAGKLIVLYVGDDSAALATLEAVLGTQTAGG